MIEPHSLFVIKFISFHTWFVFGLIAVAMVLYATEKISLELTSLFSLTALMVFFHFFPLTDHGGKILLSPEKILLGFANPALITIVSLLIIGQAVIQSNALNIIPNAIVTVSKNNATISIILSLLMVVLISAFMNNTPVVVIFIPILAQVAKNLNLSPSKVMIPLSYAAILGGMLTLIGSSTNLLVSGTIVNLGLNPIGFFEFLVPGAIMSVIGMIYIVFILPKILPDRTSNAGDYYDDRTFVSQINIIEDDDFSGKKLLEGTLPKFPDITIRLIERGSQVILPPFQDEMMVKAGDVMVISGTRDALSKLVRNKPAIFVKNLHLEEDDGENSENIEVSLKEANLAEIVVAPASRVIGRVLDQTDLYSHYHCPIIGIQRKGNLIQTKMSQLRLVAGDILLILGETDRLTNIRNSKDFILTRWSMQQVGSIARVVKTLVIFSLVVILSAFNIVPIAVTSFTAATLLIFLNCINIRQASRSIDGKISLLIVASLALGYAMQVTGGAALLADNMLLLTKGLSNIGIIAFFFIFIVMMTNILSNATTAVLFTPIAANLALKLGVDPRILIYGVIFACNCSFITPIGYQTNLLVMSPGKYKFIDFMKGGVPLSLMMCFTYIMLIKFYF